MRRIIEKKEGYAYLLDWIIRLGDLIIINQFFSTLYYFYTKNGVLQPLSYDVKLEMLLLINAVYIVTLILVKQNITYNVVSIEKVIHRSFYFITFYWVFITIGIYIFGNIRISILPWFLAFIILTVIFECWHILFRFLLKAYRKKGYNYRRAIVVGGGVNAIAIHEELVGSDYGFKILGFFDDNLNNKEALPNYLGDTSQIKYYIENELVDEVYCTLPYSKQDLILELIALADKHMVRFFLIPEFHKFIKRKLMMYTIGTVPIFTLRYEPLEHASNRFIKRLFDILFSLFVLIFIFPFIYVIFGIGIKMSSSGPIFFKQKRTGIKGHDFYCYKFRSMKINADANKKSATKEDPRITRIGQFMRKTSIDELPQFINVFLGDMSVVGPRPHMLKHTEQYSELIEKFMVRHLVKPGITGWAQVCGFRGETKELVDMEERVKKDVWYIEHWTFLLDLKIIVQTVLNVFKGEEKAY